MIVTCDMNKIIMAASLQSAKIRDCRKCQAGSRKCKHKVDNYTCKDCGGASICQHQRERNECKDCKT